MKFVEYVKFFLSKDKRYYRDIRNLLGFYPGNIALYKTAFRHKSVVAGNPLNTQSSNERMEYLGDAIFGSVIAHYLFKRFPYKDEGFLTKMRSKIASRDFLNKLAAKLGIDRLIIFQGDKNARFKSINGDAFEALIGAIYLDKGYDFTENFIVNNIIKLHVDIDEVEQTDTDYKSRLINYAQKEKKELKFSIEEEIGKGHQKLYKVALIIDEVVMGQGLDHSKKRAEQQAAQVACERLEIL